MSDEKKTGKILAELIELMNKNDLAELEVEQEGSRFRLRKKEEKQHHQPVYMSGPAAPHHEHHATPGAPHVATGKEHYLTITSPMVGTFYRASSPDADDFVNVNDHVGEESVVCIIEAMKVMNEIKSECQGIIKDILVANGEPVEYGQPLFLVEPA